MSGNKGYLIFNSRPGDWERFEKRSFDTAQAAAKFVHDHKDRWPGRNLRALEVPAEKIPGFLKDIEKTGGAIPSLLKAGKFIDEIPGGEFFGKRWQTLVAAGGAAIAVTAASGSAFAATGDFNAAARAGTREGKQQFDNNFNPKERISNGLLNIKDGRVIPGVAKMSEGASNLLGLDSLPKVTIPKIGSVDFGNLFDADRLEKERVLPVAKEIFEKHGAKALTQEVIKGRENSKYILEANELLPETLPVQIGGKVKNVAIEDALKNDTVYNQYTKSLQNQIAVSSGEQKEVWQRQLDSARGYRQSLSAQEHLPMPGSSPQQTANMGINLAPMVPS